MDLKELKRQLTVMDAVGIVDVVYKDTTDGVTTIGFDQSTNLYVYSQNLPSLRATYRFNNLRLMVDRLNLFDLDKTEYEPTIKDGVLRSLRLECSQPKMSSRIRLANPNIQLPSGFVAPDDTVAVTIDHETCQRMLAIISKYQSEMVNVTVSDGFVMSIVDDIGDEVKFEFGAYDGDFGRFGYLTSSLKALLKASLSYNDGTCDLSFGSNGMMFCCIDGIDFRLIPTV